MIRHYELRVYTDSALQDRAETTYKNALTLAFLKQSQELNERVNKRGAHKVACERLSSDLFSPRPLGGKLVPSEQTRSVLGELYLDGKRLSCKSSLLYWLERTFLVSSGRSTYCQPAPHEHTLQAES